MLAYLALIESTAEPHCCTGGGLPEFLALPATPLFFTEANECPLSPSPTPEKYR